MTVPRPIDVLNDPKRAADVPAEMLDRYIVAFATLREKVDIAYTGLTSRLPVVFNGKTVQTASGDRLLDVHEAAKKLGRSEDWLYRRARKLPFTRPDGRSLQFSEKGIEEYIQRGGRR